MPSPLSPIAYNRKGSWQGERNGLLSDASGEYIDPDLPSWNPTMCHCTKDTCAHCCPYSTLVFAFIFLGVGIFAVVYTPTIVRHGIADLIPMTSPLSHLYPLWRNTATDGFSLYRYFYFFNLTNPHDVMNYHSVPDFHPVGPFVYQEHTYNPDESIFWTVNTSIGFNYHTYLKYIPEKSGTDPETGEPFDPLTYRFTTVNPALFSIAYRINLLPAFNLTIDGIIPFRKWEICLLLDGMVNETVGDYGYFVRRTVHDLLWGYTDPLLTALNSQSAILNYSIPTIFKAMTNGSVPAPSPWTVKSGQKCPLWDDLSICNSSNGTTNFVFSGAEWNVPGTAQANNSIPSSAYEKGGLRRVGQFNQWSGQKELWWWGENGTCRKLEGSNGMSYPQGTNQNDEPYVFFDSIYRKVKLQYLKDTKVEDIETLRFVISDDELSLHESNVCYDQRYAGLFNLTRPTFGPMIVSQPYFLAVNENDQNLDIHNRRAAIINITMDKVPFSEWKKKQDMSQYQTFVDVLSITGTLLAGEAQLQSSTWLKPIYVEGCPGSFSKTLPKNITLPNNQTIINSEFPHTIVPMFYVNRKAKMSQKIGDQLKSLVFVPLEAAKYGGIALIILCGLLVLAASYTLAKRCCYNPSRQSDHPMSSDSVLTTPVGTNRSKKVKSTTDSLESAEGPSTSLMFPQTSALRLQQTEREGNP